MKGVKTFSCFKVEKTQKVLRPKLQSLSCDFGIFLKPPATTLLILCVPVSLSLILMHLLCVKNSNNTHTHSKYEKSN